MNGKNKLPTFAIIGAGKSGTTAVHHYLHQHPEVFMSDIKETNFFALEGQTRISSGKDDPYQMHHYPWSITSFDKYKKLFVDAKESILGETSPMYMYADGVIERMKKYVPNIKLIAILRQPVDRLYSRYMHLARENRTPTKTFEEALDRSTLWWRRNDLIKEGYYYTHLKKFYDSFPNHQIKVFLYDDLKHSPEKTIKEIFQFIGASETFKPNRSIEHNVSGKIKNKYVDKIIGQNSILKSMVQKIAPNVILRLKNSHMAKRILNQMRKKNLSKEPLSIELKNRFTQEVYISEILNLEKLIKRDLSDWI